MGKITLRAARVNAGLTQHEAAKRVHKSTMTIVNWEKGITTPSYADLILLSSIYGWPADDFNLQSEFADCKQEA